MLIHIFTLIGASQVLGLKEKPNIILILADDIGVNDVSWNNKHARSTPNIKKLAEDGVILDNAYSLPVCTPSRAALLTGVYPFKFGLQRGFGKQTPEGIPLNKTLLPQYLKDAGYKTHALGKWHLGFCSESYTPLKRGFDTFFGYFVGDDDEDFEETPRHQREIKKSKKKKGKNKAPKENVNSINSLDKYDSDLYSGRTIDIIKKSNKHEPFFIYMALFTKTYPRKINKKKHKGKNLKAKLKLNDHENKLKQMDLSVSKIVKALKESGQYSNTVILFISDNGGREVTTFGRRNNPNYPLRGSKGSLYEGGTKVPGFIHSPILRETGKRYSGLFHLVDVLPTLLHLADTSHSHNQNYKKLDGIDQWSSLTGHSRPPRNIMVYNIDDNLVPAVLNGPNMKPQFQIAVRENNFKLIWGQQKMLHRSYRYIKRMKIPIKDHDVDPVLELYNLDKDPGENHNIATMRYDVVVRLKNIALNFYRDLIPPRFLGLQTTKYVLDDRSQHGGVIGWCRAVVRTSCHNADNASMPRFDFMRENEAVQYYYGSLPDIMDNKMICVTQME